MAHFLLPVGGAIMLTLNSHIYTISIIQRTNQWSLIKFRKGMWMLLDISCFSLFALISTPRHGQTVRDIKNPLAIFHPQCLEIMFTEFGGNHVKNLWQVYQIPEHAFFKQPWIADFLLGGAFDIERESCSAQWDLQVYWVSYKYMQVCVSYGSRFLTVFQGAL